ncbi:cytochrome c1 [Methylonatrum kenyense]|uniref:cytochrome c1 n=1 Tax=Methylonatrum kenyense TaxID=455253 RepID=UPI0020BF9A96|nr:cytochrome c1 [Methylonatrum kenyense]MCK8516275.1 cytochrome c1 [Methylonatrum kenyense]
MKKYLMILTLVLVPAFAVGAAPVNGKLSADVDPHDKESLQRGAQAFANYCMACHQAELMRYNRVARDLGFSDEDVEEFLIFTPGTLAVDVMRNAMRQEDSQDWFGAPAPDLTMTARRHGPDWVYTFLNSFYKDENQPFGVNNLVISGVSMPHVLQELQGLPEPVYEDVDGQERLVGLELNQAGMMSPAEYRRFTRDLTNFMDYIAEPVKAERQRLGVYVIGFLLILLVLTYLLKKEFWRDVH